MLSYRVAGSYVLGVGSSVKRWTLSDLCPIVKELGSEGTQGFSQQSDPFKFKNSSIPFDILEALLPILNYFKENPWHHPLPNHWIDSKREHQNDDTGEVGFQQLKLQMSLSPTVDLFPRSPSCSTRPNPRPLLGAYPLQVPGCPSCIALPRGDLIPPLLSTPDNFCINVILESSCGFFFVFFSNIFSALHF